MAKLLNVRERVHQPFRDTLIRTSGLYASAVQDRTQLFTLSGKNDAESNFKIGGVLPSDQSMVVLALRVFLWFRNAIQRGQDQLVTSATTYASKNGDFQFSGAGSVWSAAQANIANGNAPASTQDVHRLYWQASEQLLWSFGTGQKLSFISMPSSYFPYGGGLHGSLGGATDIIHWDNGMPSHSGILRLARAVLMPPRQNVLCEATMVALPDGGNAATFATTYNGRNMLSLRDNLNAPDLAQKVVSFTFDGLFSRDVQ